MLGAQISLLSLLLVVLACSPVCVLTAAVPYDKSETAKRQLEPPVKPERFSSLEEFETYMMQLEAYFKLLGRQRFGKRSAWDNQSRALSRFEPGPYQADLTSISAKLDALLEAETPENRQ